MNLNEHNLSPNKTTHSSLPEVIGILKVIQADHFRVGLTGSLRSDQGNASDHREDHSLGLEAIRQQLHTDLAISNNVHDSQDLDSPCLTGTITDRFDLPYFIVTTPAR